MLNKLLVITVTAFFLMQFTPSWAKESRKSASLFSSKAVWNPPDETPSKIFDKCASIISPPLQGSRWINCIASEMRSAGASADATKVMELFNGESYLAEFRELGKVDLAVMSAFSYNDPSASHQEILVNGKPTVVYPSEEIDGIDIRKDPHYPGLVRKFPNAELWCMHTFREVQQQPKEGQRFIFSCPVLSGCRGCDVAGSAEIGFDFDAEGRFKKAKLLGLKAAK